MIQASAINSLQYEPELCTGCGMCVDVCPHSVFAMNSHAARLAHPDDCMECGACQVNCLAGAIAVDSGVGCASAMIMAALKGEKEATCSCG
jgi:NAD-dependent dihydropyrimidine dehydrogenase PreA subunit